MTTMIASSVETIEEAPERRSVWGSVIAGAAVALACGVMLSALGGAIGASAVDTVARDTPTAGTFTMVAGLWLLASSLISYFVGGLVASRLSGVSDPDIASMYGLAVWGIGVLITAYLLASSLMGAASTAVTATGSAVSGVARAVGSAAAPVAQQVDPERVVGELAARLRGSETATMSPEDARAEIGTLLLRRFTQGSLQQADRDRLIALTARWAGVDEAQARQRVERLEAEVSARLRAAEETARAAADKAAKGAAAASYWAFAAIALSAAAAFLGARMGTPHGTAMIRRIRRREVERA